MQKIVIALFLLCTTFTIVYAQNTQLTQEKNTRTLQLTKDAKSTDLIESPDGKWIVFVKKSNYTIPSNCFYFSEKGEHADEIWIINT
jgi:prolyl oligopeptidase PreP (S9A serine peptidase family)